MDDRAGVKGRHQVVMWLLLAHVPLFSILGLREGWSVTHTIIEVVVPLVGLWLIAGRATRPRVAMGAGGIGLMYASAVLIHVTGGVTEAHFYFFVAFGLVALYRDWVVFFAAAGFAVAHHLFFAMTSATLFSQAYQVEDPVFWALVHIAFVTVVTAVQAVGMYDVGQSVKAKAELETAVARADERRVTALTLHDDVVQALATANYARELGEDQLSSEAIGRALHASRKLVTELMADSPVDAHVLERRGAAMPRSAVT